MITTNICDPSRAKQVIASKGPFSVIEYEKDRSIDPKDAQLSYFASKMDVLKRQLVVDITYEIVVITQRLMMQMNMDTNYILCPFQTRQKKLCLQQDLKIFLIL